jgi:hypothetical protein
MSKGRRHNEEYYLVGSDAVCSDSLMRRDLGENVRHALKKREETAGNKTRPTWLRSSHLRLSHLSHSVLISSSQRIWKRNANTENEVLFAGKSNVQEHQKQSIIHNYPAIA